PRHAGGGELSRRGRFPHRNLRANAGLSATVDRRMPDFRVGRGCRGWGIPRSLRFILSLTLLAALGGCCAVPALGASGCAGVGNGSSSGSVTVRSAAVGRG